MILNEFESKQLLEEYNIPITKGYFIKYDKYFKDNIYDKLNLFNIDKYVIKIISPDIIHKSDAGGVILNVPLELVFIEINKMLKNIYIKLPQAKIEGIYLQEMADINGIECIIGIKEDIQFGKVITFGFGGIYTEIFKDISMRILPITENNIREMIKETKVYKILNGYRNKYYDIDAIVNTLIKASKLADNHNIKELDINPLMVYKSGVKALDVRIML